MFRFFGRNKVHPVKDNTVAEDIKSVSATKAPDSAKPPEAGKQKKKSFFKRLFGRFLGKKPISTSEEPKESPKKTCGLFEVFNCCKTQDTVDPSSSTIKKHQDEAVPLQTAKRKEKTSKHVIFKDQPDTADMLDRPDTADMLLLLPDVPQNDSVDEHFISETLIREEEKKKTESNLCDIESYPTVDHYGFPNIGQTCYMNSSLQSLLTLKDFVKDIRNKQEIWSSVPQAKLLRHFMRINDAHTSTDAEWKSCLLRSFRNAVLFQGQEFSDNEQEDAHEFLTSVLNQIRGLSPQLQDKAARLGLGYSCPVEEHLVFKMENIRTCKSCGVQSRRTEEFTNLSVDFPPGGSVELMIQFYQKEKELNYRCECGGNVSAMRTEFKTLPKVLILHLKRFSYSSNFELMKVEDPVELQRDLVLSSEQEAGCFSLVSMISHYGVSGEGHYICDSVHPKDDPNKPTDDWLVFNDGEVYETTGKSVCDNRQEAAYILFYKRHE